MKRETMVVLGAGGHSRVVVEALKAMGYMAVQLLDDDPTVSIAHGPITDAMLRRLASTGTNGFIVGVGSVNAEGCALRDRLFMLALSTELVAITVFCRTAVVLGQVGQGVFLGHGSMVMPGAVVGSNSIINTGAIVEHDCQVGWSCHIATGAILCGGVQVGNLVHVGAGAVVRQGVVVGDGATIGMGAVVLEDVAPGETVVGNPARILCRLHASR